MSDEELLHLFTGYGYRVMFVEGDDLDAQLYGALDWAYHEIRRIQQAARSGHPIEKPQWPVILLRSLKGWTGIKEMDGVPIEGSYRSHQVPAPDVKQNPAHLKLLEQWLRSYHIEELLDANGRPKEDILEQCPKGNRRMGSNPHTFGGRIRHQPVLPDIHRFAVKLGDGTAAKPFRRGSINVSNAEQLGYYLKEVVLLNPHAFRIFSPDEQNPTSSRRSLMSRNAISSGRLRHSTIKSPRMMGV